MKLKYRLERLYKFEYWSFWFFYAPFVLQWLYYSIKSLNFIYFTRVNHKTPFGAFFEYSKNSMCEQISDRFLPKTIYYHFQEEVKTDLSNDIYNESFIYKPDIGERGVGVDIYYSKEKWSQEYHNQTYPCLIQEYIDLPIELGILFYKFPSGNKGITSVVGKEFLSVTGNGKNTLEELVNKEIRATTRIDFLKNKFDKLWNTIISDGESILLEEIGNHNRGTTFYNYNHIINAELVKIMDEITQNIPGFHYGRLDLKCESIEHLYIGENIKIIEVNGAASEAAHIYDPNMKLLKAYKDVWHNNKIVFQISQELKRNGIKTPNTLIEFVKAYLKH